MADTTQYAVRQDVIDRLSQTGILYVADDDVNKVAGETELVRSVDPAIAEAASEIDCALEPWINLPFSQSTTDLNPWLRNRAIDIAAEHIAARKGGGVPEPFVEAAKRSREWLEKVRLGEMRIPDLVYPIDAYSLQLRHTNSPRVARPKVVPTKLGRLLRSKKVIGW